MDPASSEEGETTALMQLVFDNREAPLRLAASTTKGVIPQKVVEPHRFLLVSDDKGERGHSHPSLASPRHSTRQSRRAVRPRQKRSNFSRWPCGEKLSLRRRMLSPRGMPRVAVRRLRRKRAAAKGRTRCEYGFKNNTRMPRPPPPRRLVFL